jgi:hypothetical protein
LLPPAAIAAACIALVTCLTPVTLYLFWLAAVNRRDRPTVADGRWDFVGLLAALGGFLVCGWAAVSLWAADLSPFVGGGFGNVWKARAVNSLGWAAAVGGYAVLVGGLAARGWRRRAGTLAVYNVEPAAADDAVRDALAGVGLSAERYGNTWSDGRGLVEAVPFHALKHVSVRILATDPQLREELERGLRAALGRRPGADNPAAAWIGTAAVSTFVTTAVAIGLMFVMLFFR